MAQINIQEKSSMAWLWWATGLVVVALLAWWLLAANRTDDVVNEPAPAFQAAPVENRVTDLSVLTSATAANLVNRDVALTSVPVAKVVSDKGFWIGSTSSANQGVFVVRGNQDASYSAADGAVNAGQQVSVYGVVQQMPSDLTQQMVEWNLKSTDQSMLATQPIYIRADSVRIASR